MSTFTVQIRCHHVETSQLICPANKLAGFYMIATLVLSEWIQVEWINVTEEDTTCKFAWIWACEWII